MPERTDCSFAYFRLGLLQDGDVGVGVFPRALGSPFAVTSCLPTIHPPTVMGLPAVLFLATKSQFMRCPVIAN